MTALGRERPRPCLELLGLRCLRFRRGHGAATTTGRRLHEFLRLAVLFQRYPNCFAVRGLIRKIANEQQPFVAEAPEGHRSRVGGLFS